MEENIEDDKKPSNKPVKIIVVLVILLILIIAGIWYISKYPVIIDGVPAGSINDVNITSNISVKITLGAFTRDVHPSDCKFILKESNNNEQEISFYMENAPVNSSTPLVSSDSSVTCIYFDYSPLGNLINNGDYLNITGLKPNTTYHIDIFYIPDTTIASLTGQTEFTTTP